jgi:DNA-directed RNA polymerase subunit L
MSESIEILNISIKRHTVTAENAPFIRRDFGLDRLPLATAKISLEIRGVSVAVINALRRTITNEMMGNILMIPNGGYKIKSRDPEEPVDKITTDRFMLQQFMNLNISSIRLKSQIPKDVIDNLRLSLNVVNDGVDVKHIYSGDLVATRGTLPHDLFNPTTPIAFIQPNTCIIIEDIYISSEFGRSINNALYNVTCCAAYTHLDIEQYTEKEQTEEGGIAVEKSGYKQSCLVANPRHHLLTAVIPAIGENLTEGKIILVDACNVIREKLRFIHTTLEKSDMANQGIVLKQITATEGTLAIIGESHTIGNVLAKTMFELYPDIYVNFKVIDAENLLSFNIEHPATEIREIILKTIEKAIVIFETIRAGIAAKELSIL